MSRAAFLAGTGWSEASTVPLVCDASARRYSRLTRADGTSAVLMQAPTSSQVDRRSLTQFLRVANHLAGLGLSPPRILAEDVSRGLILMEDLGDDTLARLLAGDPETARAAYLAAAALPNRLSGGALPAGVNTPDRNAVVGMVGLTYDLMPGAAALKDRVLASLSAALDTLAPGPGVLSLRDYHGDNLLWLPSRQGDARVGLLDFQDAVVLPAGYDLASLFDDPRRVVPELWRQEAIATFARNGNLALDAAEARIEALSLLRNLRILGIFHRLATSGKPRYQAFLPRTAALVARSAAHPALAHIRTDIDETLRRAAPWSEGEAA